MTQGLGVRREQIIIAGIGFFIGRAVCFSMNPLVAAFWAAALMEDAGGIWLFLAMAAGITSRMGAAGILTFGIYGFLMLVANRAYMSHRQTEDAQPIEKQTGDYIRLSVLAGGCLIVAQVVVWTLQGNTITNSIFPANGQLRYLWTNQKHTVLGVLQAVLEGVVTGSLSYLLVCGFSREERDKIRAGGDDRKAFISGCLLAAIILYGLPGSLYATFALAEAACYLVILWVAYVYGMLESTTAAAFGGAVLAYKLNDFSVLGLVTLFGVAAGLLREMGRIGIFSGMAAAALVVNLAVPDTSLAGNSLKGLVTAGVIFLFMPKSLMQRHCREDKTLQLVQGQLEKTVREKVRDLANGFFQLQNGLLRLPRPEMEFTEQDYSRMYLQMKENVCDQCEGRYRCYHVNPKETFVAAKSIFCALDRQGGIRTEDVPQEFAGVCNNQAAFMIGANVSFERAKSNLILKQKLAEGRETLARQVADVAVLMNEFSSELVQDCERDEAHELLLRLRLRPHQVDVRQLFCWKGTNGRPDVLYVAARCHAGTLMTARELAGHITAVYEKKYRPQPTCRSVIIKNYEVYSFTQEARYYMIKGVRRQAYEERTNGDNFSFLDLEQGHFIAMLSDGMGTGEQAYQQSAMLIELLEEFLEAGFARKMALNLANSVLSLNFEQNGFTTLDLVDINLYTGICQMVKVGAAATFIKRKEEVETVVSTSLPAGVLSVMDCQCFEYLLEKGDMVIMVSDGIIDAIVVEEKEEYLRDIICQITTENPQKLADLILHKVAEAAPNRVKDDMTVMAFSIWEK